MYCRHIFFFAVISTAIEHCTRFLSLFLSLFSLFPIPCLAYFPSSLLSSLASSTSTIRTFFYLHRPLLTFVAVSRYISRLRFTSALKKKKIPNPYRFLRFETFPSAFDRSYNFYRKRIRTGFLFNQDFALYTFLLMHEHRSEHPRSLSIPPRFISTYIVIFGFVAI